MSELTQGASVIFYAPRFSTDGKYIIAIGIDQKTESIFSYELWAPMKDLMSIAKKRYSYKLSPEEKRKYRFK